MPVPVHAADTPGSSAYILRDSGARFLVTTSRARWNAVYLADQEGLPDLAQVVLLNELGDDECGHVRVSGVEAWLARGNGTANSSF